MAKWLGVSDMESCPCGYAPTVVIIRDAEHREGMTIVAQAQCMACGRKVREFRVFELDKKWAVACCVNEWNTRILSKEHDDEPDDGGPTGGTYTLSQRLPAIEPRRNWLARAASWLRGNGWHGQPPMITNETREIAVDATAEEIQAAMDDANIDGEVSQSPDGLSVRMGARIDDDGPGLVPFGGSSTMFIIVCKIAFALASLAVGVWVALELIAWRG